jgi:hypothetical protein
MRRVSGPVAAGLVALAIALVVCGLGPIDSESARGWLQRAMLPGDRGTPQELEGIALRRAAAVAAISKLRLSVRDPDSLVIDKMFVRDPTRAICIVYRSDTETGVAEVSRAVVVGETLWVGSAVWREHCAGDDYIAVERDGT